MKKDTPLLLSNSYKRNNIIFEINNPPPKKVLFIILQFKKSNLPPLYDGSNDVSSESDPGIYYINYKIELSEDFTSNNIIYCYFKKMNRKSKKWNLVLNKGICDVDNKEIIFGECQTTLTIDE